MKTELHSVYRSDEKGVAIFVTLILLFIVTIAGVTILAVAGRDRIASSDMSAVRGVAEAANTALDACENQLSQKSPLMLSVLNKYLNDKSYRWFFSTDSMSANKEKKISLGNGYSYSAEIMAYDTASNVLQVRGIGYGRSDERKSVVAQYRLSGIQKIVGGEIPKYALYLAGRGRNFDIPIEVSGNVYIGLDFHFNNNADDSKIHGFLKTGVGALSGIDTTSGIDALNLSIDSGVYVGTGLAMNNDPFTCSSRLGIEGNLWLNSKLTVKSDGWFNGSIMNVGSGVIDMSGNIIHHSGNIPMSRVINESKADTLKPKIPDIAQKIGVGNTNDSSWGLNTTGLRDIAYPLPLGIDAASLTDMYNLCDPARKKNGYMVVHDSAGSVGINNSSYTFSGKVIFLLQRGLNINGNFFDMTSDSRILIIATGGAVINSFGGYHSRSFNGLVYLRDSAFMQMQVYGTYSINGAIHLADARCKWQMNNSTYHLPSLVKFNFNASMLRDFVSMGIITIPTPGGATPSATQNPLVLTDFKIRPELLSVSY